MASDFSYLAIDPRNPDGPRVDVIFPASYTLRIYKHSPVDFENLRAAKHVLDDTDRIFFGVREYNEGGWCYTGRPQSWYIKEGIETPFPKSLVFAVYVNPLLHVYECRAEFVADDDPLCPANWRTRYGGLTWPINIS